MTPDRSKRQRLEDALSRVNVESTWDTDWTEERLEQALEDIELVVAGTLWRGEAWLPNPNDGVLRVHLPGSPGNPPYTEPMDD